MPMRLVPGDPFAISGLNGDPRCWFLHLLAPVAQFVETA